MAKTPQFEHPKLRQLAKLLGEVATFYGGPGLHVRKGANGWQFSQVPDVESFRENRRTVAIVRIPEAVEYPDQPPPPPESEPLAVKPLAVLAREVQYKSLPPLAPDTQQTIVEGRLAERNILPGYEFASAEFRAYPAIGCSVDDYEEFVVKEGAALDRSQMYLYAHLDDRNIWILDRPASAASIDWVVVRNVRADTDQHVQVQDVKLSDTDPWDGLMQPVGEAYDVPVHPHYVARDFKALVSKEATLQRWTPILQLVRSGGTLWLLQDVRFDLIKPRGRIRHTDCVAAFTEGA